MPLLATQFPSNHELIPPDWNKIQDHRVGIKSTWHPAQAFSSRSVSPEHLHHTTLQGTTEASDHQMTESAGRK